MPTLSGMGLFYPCWGIMTCPCLIKVQNRATSYCYTLKSVYRRVQSSLPPHFLPNYSRTLWPCMSVTRSCSGPLSRLHGMPPCYGLASGMSWKRVFNYYILIFYLALTYSVVLYRNYYYSHRPLSLLGANNTNSIWMMPLVGFESRTSE